MILPASRMTASGTRAINIRKKRAHIAPAPMKTFATPQLNVPAGTEFGHRGSLASGRKPRVLVQVTDGISIGPGLHLLVAPNGAGKTTLLRTLARLHPALHGSPCTTGHVHYVSDELKMDGELKPKTLFEAWFIGEGLDYARKLAARFKLDMN